jgi:hypothetical protein
MPKKRKRGSNGFLLDSIKKFDGRDADDDKSFDEMDVLYDATKILLIENAKAMLLPKSG